MSKCELCRESRWQPRHPPGGADAETGLIRALVGLLTVQYTLHYLEVSLCSLLISHMWPVACLCCVCRSDGAGTFLGMADGIAS